MKKTTMISTILAGVLSTATFADNSGFTAGLGFGNMDVSVSGADGGSSTGFMLGYDFGNNWSAELTMNSGSWDAMGMSGDIDTTAVYGTYRSAYEGGYFMGKIGFLSEDVSLGGFSESESGLSYGIGGGYRFNESFGVEVEYTIIESDVTLLGANLVFKF